MSRQDAIREASKKLRQGKIDFSSNVISHTGFLEVIASTLSGLFDAGQAHGLSQAREAIDSIENKYGDPDYQEAMSECSRAIEAIGATEGDHEDN